MPIPVPTPNSGQNTNSGLGPGPGLIISGPNGTLIRYAVTGWSPGVGNFGSPTVIQPVGGIMANRVGDVSLSGYKVTGTSGQLDVVYTTGAAGTVQHVAALTDKILSPVGYLGVFLDTQNRAYIVVTDVAGVVVAQTIPQGPAITSGTRQHVFMEWNSVGAINGGDFVAVELGETELDTWLTEPTTTWTPFQPVWLMVGDGFGSYGHFVGTIGNIQLGSGSAPTFAPPQVAQSHDVSCAIVAGSTLVNSSVKQNYAVSASPSASSTVTAAAVANRGVSGHPSGLATISATATTAGP